jgi:Cd2+/Zn2+-exporting ATPase/Cu+-exporting ATPase
MDNTQIIEVPVAGMDCAECTNHVRHALEKIPGVHSVDVILSSEKAIIRAEPGRVEMGQIRSAVISAGYTVPDDSSGFHAPGVSFSRKVLTVFALITGALLFVIVIGEWLGLFQTLTSIVPRTLGSVIVIAAGWPLFVEVFKSAFKRQVTSRTLMTLGVAASLLIGEWPTAGVLVFMMYIGNYVESFTADQSRKAIKDLTVMMPQTARVEQDGREEIIPVTGVTPGVTVIVRPGEKIPVDGSVLTGTALVNQAALTGESMPVEIGPGNDVYAATLLQSGSVRLQATHTGRDTAFGRIVHLVEEAEAKKGTIQKFADKFSGYYLPVVSGIALLTLIFSRDVNATVAVLAVACSCSIALATPIAMMASIGAAAKRGLMIKGGIVLETLSSVDTLLIDKTGTLTLGKPELTNIICLNGSSENEILTIAASAERYSEHPLASAIREVAHKRELRLTAPENFQNQSGIGLTALVEDHEIRLGSRLVLNGTEKPVAAAELESAGRTVLYVFRDDVLIGLLGLADILRGDVPEAIEKLQEMGIHQIEILTGDNNATAAQVAAQLGVGYRAELLPEDKIRIVKEYQKKGRRVVMVGDGINDAPALAQANVGIAMASSGSDIAIEAADIAILRTDWMLVPEAFAIAHRTMRVVRGNLLFAGFYNVIGISLAALGFLPPALAATLQIIPDLGILGNSSRLLKQKGVTK